MHKLGASAEARSLYTLATDAKLLDQSQVRFTVFAGDVLQVALALTNQLQQTAPCGEIFFVDLEMFGELFDALSRDTNLNSGATGVSFVLLQVFDDCVLLVSCNHTLAILTDEYANYKLLLQATDLLLAQLKTRRRYYCHRFWR